VIYDPTADNVPKEIMDAAIKIDHWAKMNGWKNYAIGPIRNRFDTDIAREIKEIVERLERIEAFLVL